MAEKVYIDGKFYNRENAKISVFDHGLLYGDGVFEGIRAYNHKIFRLKEHVERLYESAASIMLKIPISKKKMMEDIEASVKKNNLKDSYIRVLVTRGQGSLGLDPNLCKKPSVIIIAATIQLYPKKVYENGLTIVTAATPRIQPEALNPKIKSLNYLNNILAKIEGINAGTPETLMLNHNGFVAECTGDNIFIIKDNAIFTPPEEAGILMGITRETVIELAWQLDIPVFEQNITRHDIYVADECFLTGTAAEIISVVKIDGRKINNGKCGQLTNLLAAAYKDETLK